MITVAHRRATVMDCTMVLSTSDGKFYPFKFNSCVNALQFQYGFGVSMPFFVNSYNVIGLLSGGAKDRTELNT